MFHGFKCSSSIQRRHPKPYPSQSYWAWIVFRVLIHFPKLILIHVLKKLICPVVKITSSKATIGSYLQYTLVICSDRWLHLVFSLLSNVAIKKLGELIRIELNELHSNIVIILIHINEIRLMHQCNYGVLCTSVALKFFNPTRVETFLMFVGGKGGADFRRLPKPW